MSTTSGTAFVLQKGAIVSLDPATGAGTVIPFQFNPASLRRTIEPMAVGGEPGGHSSAVRFTGSPVETLQFEVEIDALATGATVPAQAEGRYGILPQLAALELLVYPSTAALAANAALLGQGVLEIAPYQAPLVLLTWGANRSIPIKLTSLSVEEQAFAPVQLDPVRATVAIGAQVLSAADLAPGTPGYTQFIAYQQVKERIAGYAGHAGG